MTYQLSPSPVRSLLQHQLLESIRSHHQARNREAYNKKLKIIFDFQCFSCSYHFQSRAHRNIPNPTKIWKNLVNLGIGVGLCPKFLCPLCCWYWMDGLTKSRHWKATGTNSGTCLVCVVIERFASSKPQNLTDDIEAKIIEQKKIRDATGVTWSTLFSINWPLPTEMKITALQYFLEIEKSIGLKID